MNNSYNYTGFLDLMHDDDKQDEPLKNGSFNQADELKSTTQNHITDSQLFSYVLARINQTD